MKKATVPLAQRRKLLRKFREQYDITLTEFGKHARLSHPMLSQFERGDRDLSPEAWARVLAAMSSLLAEDNGKRLAEIAEAEETAAKLGVVAKINLVRKLRDLSGLTQAEVADLVRISDSKLSLYEDGLVELTEDEKNRLVRVLHKVNPTGWLSQMNSHAAIEELGKGFGKKSEERLIEERKGFVKRLENLNGIDDPVIAEVIESYRREIETLEKQLAETTPVSRNTKEEKL